MSLPSPSYTSDKKSFAYDTVKIRWPKIIKGCIEDAQDYPQVIGDFEQLLKSFEADTKIAKFTQEEIKLNPDLLYYNENFVDCTWQNGPWLFLECYLYQVINNIFLKHQIIDFDVFNNLKQSTLVSSEFGITELCKKLSTFDFNLTDEVKYLYFKEFIDISLWGNSTDLSLLSGDVTLEDIKSIQGEEVRKQNEKNILVNDTNKVFDYLLTEDTKTEIDIILDNSGFELLSDIVLAIFLLETKAAERVNFHCKKIPWFVSDTLPKDFEELFKELSEFNNEYVDEFITNAKGLLRDGKLSIKVNKFWTLSNPFWDLPKFDIYNDLKNSKLLIFKGDLNYRKLTNDLWWDKTTPFDVAIQDLAKANLPIMTLRTCKADVVVGLAEGVDEKLREVSGEFWAASGKYAVISFFKP